MLPDDGYFPRGHSMLRRVQEEKAVGLFYGQRALCIGALKPLNYVGTSEHTHGRTTPFKRLAHTGQMFEAVMFGSRAQAGSALHAVAGMHRRVAGTLPEDAGPHFPQGTPYRAHDPELMWWTVAVMIDSAEWFYERMVRRMTHTEREAFYGDYVRFAELFGMPREAAQGSYAEFRAWYDAELRSDRVFLTEEARRVGYFTAFEIPMPASRQPAKHVHDAIMRYSLPAPVRRHYGLRQSPAQVATARAAIEAFRRVRPVMPRRLARGSCIPEFEMVAATERRRIARGEATPQVPAGTRTRPRAAA